MEHKEEQDINEAATSQEKRVLDEKELLCNSFEMCFRAVIVVYWGDFGGFSKPFIVGGSSCTGDRGKPKILQTFGNEAHV